MVSSIRRSSATGGDVGFVDSYLCDCVGNSQTSNPPWISPNRRDGDLNSVIQDRVDDRQSYRPDSLPDTIDGRYPYIYVPVDRKRPHRSYSGDGWRRWCRNYLHQYRSKFCPDASSIC